MKKVLLAIIFGISFLRIGAQIVNKNQTDNLFRNDSTTFSKEVQVKIDGTTKYTDYKMFNINNDTTIVDTTLTLAKNFKFNYRSKDDFELIPFHNQGQTYNKLAYNFENNSIFSIMGMESKMYDYYNINDIPFYYVPTPTSEFMYRTGLEQGQFLNAFIHHPFT